MEQSHRDTTRRDAHSNGGTRRTYSIEFHRNGFRRHNMEQYEGNQLEKDSAPLMEDSVTTLRSAPQAGPESRQRRDRGGSGAQPPSTGVAARPTPSGGPPANRDPLMRGKFRRRGAFVSP
ncbi:hypothetical protein N7532_000812 [Penicillium argentinense]|uniref:Uncharacterized protein n=1 Tax=Penicillium argentinense TaxID=1131581 RepID=A0A9W9G689_9EURO|nr:uncharacterized protein N7532_000812 [Penicillium argentinense]KAJ5112767.1 hypothetical protein N7532_000812 [Penicillium argentinense]